MSSLLNIIIAISLIATALGGTQDIDLSSLLQSSVVHQPEVFHHAISIVNNLDSAASCHRLAVKDLIESCHTFDSPGHAVDNVALDLVKTVFATRLAVCELTGAHATIPPQCLSILPEPEERGLKCLLPGSRCGTTKPAAFPTAGQKQIDTCLAGLETRPQWWTSYSNARQNAVVMCHAARGETEREQQLHAYRAMSEASLDMSATLSKTSQYATQVLAAQEKFAQVVKALQASFAQDVDAKSSSLSDKFHAMVEQAEATLQGVTWRVSQGFDTVSKSMDDLQGKIHASKQVLQDISTTIQDHSTSIVTFTKQSEDNQGRILTMQDEAIAIVGNGLGRVHNGILDVQLIVRELAEVVAVTVAGHESLGARMDAIGKVVVNLQEHFDQVDSLMQHHITAQDQMFQKLTAQIASTTGMASNLAAKIASIDMRGLEHIFGIFEYLRYVKLMVVIAFLFWMLHKRLLKSDITKTSFECLVLGTALFISRHLYYATFSNVLLISRDMFLTYMTIDAWTCLFLLAMPVLIVWWKIPDAGLIRKAERDFEDEEIAGVEYKRAVGRRHYLPPAFEDTE